MPPKHDDGVTMDVLVIGAGFVGGAAAARLAADGHRVTAVRRTPQEDEDGIRWLAADVTTPEGLAELPDRATAVVFCLPPGGRDVDAYRRAHVDVPRQVVEHLQEAPERVVLTTSTAVYGQDHGEVVDETSPTSPDRPTATVLVEAEHALGKLAPMATSLRLGGIYGPGRTRLVEQVREGEATWSPGQWTNRIHRDDAAGAIAHVLALDPPPPVCNVVDDTPAERRDVLHWLSAFLGAAPPTQAAPGAGGGRGTNKRVDNGLLRSTGWAPTYPSWREGYAQMLA